MINITETQIGKQTYKQPLPLDILHMVPGIWVNGKYFWLQNSTEKVIYDEEIIMHIKHETVHSKIQFSNIYVSNHSKQTKEISILAMHHFSNVGQNHLTFISPTDQHIFHHANSKVFLVNGQYHKSHIKECTTTPLWHAYTDQVWSSIQKGHLKYQPMVKGAAASIFAMKMSISPHETDRMSTWAISGSSKNELTSLEKALINSL